MAVFPHPGTRVRSLKLFLRWRQTPGTVLEVDRNLGVILVRFDNGVERWVAPGIMEAIPDAD